MRENNTLHTYFGEDNLTLAWERVVRWKDRATKDYFGIKMFNHKLDENLKNLSNTIISGDYKPTRPQKFYVPKASKTQRTKSMLIIEDALVYQAIANVIAYRNFDKISDNNNFVFGSVLTEEVKEGTELLNSEEEKNLFFFKHYLGLYKKFADSVNKAILEDEVTHKFETDITGFFDSIPHYNLLNILGKKFNAEPEILDILSECLDCWSGTRESYTFGVGIPQGSQPSFFLANILLHDLDNLIKHDGYIYYRYMDDIRIYAFDEDDLINALVKIDKYLKGIGLSLNAKKTSIEKISSQKEKSIISFDFHYDDDASDNLKMKVSEDFQSLIEQDGQKGEFSNFQTITDKNEIEKFWKTTLKDAINDLKSLFKDNPIELKEEAEDRKILDIAYRFRSSIKGLKALKNDYKIAADLNEYWFFLLKKFPWRTNQFCWIFNEYKNNDDLKNKLLELIDDFDSYEWVRHHLYSTLAVSQKIIKKEWQILFRKLNREETDYYARLALYKLLLFHLSDEQQFSQIASKILEESNVHMKKELLFYSKAKQLKQFTIQELTESFGL